MDAFSAHRFFYGNSEWPSSSASRSGKVSEARRREMKMLRQARQQINAQKMMGDEIAKSSIEGAQIIASEILEQTEALEQTTNRVLENIIGSIIMAADQISDSIDMLGDRLCIELTEIKWQLTQRNYKLDDILEVLNENRHNEARQLVQQGLRHYINEEFEEAEERFKLALYFDSTDYQVIMNLAYIEIHKENPAQAFIYLRKALSLPVNLDSVSKARTLWATARLHYTEKNFSEAYTYAEEAFKHDNKDDPRVFYDLGVYAALAGRKSFALEKIAQAIHGDVTYFGKCAVDPDLKSVETDILLLLARLSIEAEFRARQMVEQVDGELADLENEKKLKNRGSFMEEAHRIIQNAIAGLQRPSYSFCRRCADVMDKIKELLSKYKGLIPLYLQLEKYQGDCERISSLCSSTPEPAEKSKDVPRAVYWLMIAVSYILPGAILASAGIEVEGMSWSILFAIWPVWIVLDFISSHYGMTAIVEAGLMGLLIVGIMWGAVCLVRRARADKYDRMSRALSIIRQQFYISERTVMKVLNDINSIHSSIREQIADVRL